MFYEVMKTRMNHLALCLAPGCILEFNHLCCSMVEWDEHVWDQRGLDLTSAGSLRLSPWASHFIQLQVSHV